MECHVPFLSKKGCRFIFAACSLDVIRESASGRGSGKGPPVFFAAVLLTATGWGRVTRRRRRRRGRVAWVRGLGRPPAGSRVQRSPRFGSQGSSGSCGEVLVAGFAVFADRADGEGSMPEAAVLWAATAWGRAWPVLSGSSGLFGATKRHFAENDPTSQAVWGITNCIDSGDLDELT